MRRLPKKHVFPGGFVVKIILTDLPADDAGGYSTPSIDEGLIEIDRHRTPRQQWHDLSHELIHAAVDAWNYVQRRIAP